jgi:prevent-host-death family protein
VTVYCTIKQKVYCRVNAMPRIVTAEDLRARLGKELDAIRASDDALYVSKRGRLAAVLLGADRYAELVERIEYLEDSLAALQAREERDDAVPWHEVRG